MLVMTRNFIRKNSSENKISFEYKVDGAGCRRGNKACSNGLYFYINEKQKLKADMQFQWKKFEVKDDIEMVM